MLSSRQFQFLLLVVLTSVLVLPSNVVSYLLTKRTTISTGNCGRRSEQYLTSVEFRHRNDKRKAVRCFSTEPNNEESVTTTTVETASLTDESATNPLGLTPELETIVTAFERIGDDKLRYKQLLYMANQLPPFDPTKQIPQNKVPGCLSTVYIDGYVERIDNSNEYRIYFVGDSDGLLTKGLVSLLVRGLSGNTATQIQHVNPNFIQTAGIATSLTPGRNNGFLNMLAVMKRKALELEASAKQLPDTLNEKSTTLEESSSTTTTESSDRPKYDAILTALQALKPEVTELKDTSYQHAGHREAGTSVESHFELYIVAEAFEGLNLIKRHKLVYMMLGDIMPKIHALNIKAKTPVEIQQ